MSLKGVLSGIILVTVMIGTVAVSQAAEECPDNDLRFCACHRTGPPESPTGFFDHCSDCSSRIAHLNHGDLEGMCNSCGNGIKECCVVEDFGGTDVATDCCNLDTDPQVDENHCDNRPEFAGLCEPEECDDGNNDCRDGCFDCKILNCEDGDPCTTDDCTDQGLCETTPADDGTECSDDNVCTDGDECVGGECVPGGPVDCEDGDACTTHSCDSVDGCIQDPVLCSDGDSCSTDSCDEKQGCKFGSVSCDDNDACTAESCDAEGGCANDPINCDDAVDCTADSCDSETGCVHTPDDSACDDGDVCTVDSCDVEEGCVHIEIPPEICDTPSTITGDGNANVVGCSLIRR